MGLHNYKTQKIIDSSRSLLADAATRCHAPERTSDQNVHEIRKALKRVRAYWRLMRFVLGKQHSKAGNERCKQAAKLLAPARDHVVMLGTLDELGRNTDAKLAMAFGQAKQAMHHQSLNNEPTQGIDWDKAADLIRNDDAAWSGLDPEKIDPADIKRGWKRTRKKARKGYRQSCDHPDPEALHNWRKWVKRWMQQEELLHPHKQGRIDLLNDLGDLLGLHHDLVVLSEKLWLSDHFGGKPQKKVREALDKQQADLEQQALKLGEKIFT